MRCPKVIPGRLMQAFAPVISQMYLTESEVHEDVLASWPTILRVIFSGNVNCIELIDITKE